MESDRVRRSGTSRTLVWLLIVLAVLLLLPLLWSLGMMSMGGMMMGGGGMAGWGSMAGMHGWGLVWAIGLAVVLVGVILLAVQNLTRG